MANDETVTRVLARLTAGDERAADELLPLVYEELHRMAERRMNRQRADHTLQATALVNEAWLKLFRDGAAPVLDREHFLALAATAMRSILVDHARGKQREKRKPQGHEVALDGLVTGCEERAALDIVALDEALQRLEEFDETMARVVELRFFGGLSVQETAVAIGLSVRKVEREWTAARAWLRAELS